VTTANYRATDSARGARNGLAKRLFGPLAREITGTGHALTHRLAVLGYHVTGSTGTLFLYGIVVGAIGLLGLSLLLAGASHTSPRP
jgi:hypothetical protein